MEVAPEKDGVFVSSQELEELQSEADEAYHTGYNEGYVQGQVDAGNKILL